MVALWAPLISILTKAMVAKMEFQKHYFSLLSSILPSLLDLFPSEWKYIQLSYSPKKKSLSPITPSTYLWHFVYFLCQNIYISVLTASSANDF